MDKEQEIVSDMRSCQIYPSLDCSWSRKLKNKRNKGELTLDLPSTVFLFATVFKPQAFKVSRAICMIKKHRKIKKNRRPPNTTHNRISAWICTKWGQQNYTWLSTIQTRYKENKLNACDNINKLGGGWPGAWSGSTSGTPSGGSFRLTALKVKEWHNDCH